MIASRIRRYLAVVALFIACLGGGRAYADTAVALDLPAAGNALSELWSVSGNLIGATAGGGVVTTDGGLLKVFSASGGLISQVGPLPVGQLMGASSWLGTAANGSAITATVIPEVSWGTSGFAFAGGSVLGNQGALVCDPTTIPEGFPFHRVPHDWRVLFSGEAPGVPEPRQDMILNAMRTWKNFGGQDVYPGAITKVTQAPDVTVFYIPIPELFVSRYGVRPRGIYLAPPELDESPQLMIDASSFFASIPDNFWFVMNATTVPLGTPNTPEEWTIQHVAAHEFGHVLGMRHPVAETGCRPETSVMIGGGSSLALRTSPALVDINVLRRLLNLPAIQ